MSRWVPNYPVIRATSRARGIKEVTRLTQGVLTGGKRLARRGSHKHGSERPVAGPRMADSLKRTFKNTTKTIQADVTATVSWSASMAAGSRAHKIPKSGRARPLLKFKWERGRANPRLRRRMTRTGFFLFSKVRHPGNKRANRFLQIPLATYGRRYNFRVTIKPNSRTYLP